MFRLCARSCNHGSVKALVVIASCALACGVVGFDITERSQPIFVQGSPIGGLVPAGLIDIPLTIDLEAETQKRGTGPASSVKLKKLVIEVTAPDDGTLDLLDALTILIAAEGLPEREIARVAQVPEGVDRVSLETLPVELIAYVKAGARIRSRATGNQPARDHTLVAVSVFHVEI